MEGGLGKSGKKALNCDLLWEQKLNSTTWKIKKKLNSTTWKKKTQLNNLEEKKIIMNFMLGCDALNMDIHAFYILFRYK